MHRVATSPSPALRERRAYVSLAQASAHVGVSERTIRRWIADGRLVGYRVGPRLLRVDRVELEALFSAIPTTNRSRR